MTSDEKGESLNRAIWAIALPAMLTNVATALFGIADLWIIGRLGDADLQAGVEIGAKYMMGLLVVFNFLRTGTIALTAQSAGRGELAGQAATLVRALGAAAAIGLVLLLLMPVAIPFGLDALHARGGAGAAALAYVGIRYWGGLLWLLNAAITGWLIGRKRVREILIVEVVANLFHVGLGAFFVLRLGWGVEGVAAATLLSEALKLIAVGLVAAREPPAREVARVARDRATWSGAALAALARLNRDLFIRTLLLTAAILLLVRDGAHEGALVVAANAIIYQFFIVSALILDGLESAAQVLCGEAVGARDRDRFARLVRALLGWGLLFGALFSLVFLVAGRPIAATFSTNPEVVATTLLYLPWAILIPLAGVSSYVLDGVYVGATWTRAMLATMAVAFAVYGLLLLGTGPLGNHGLWLAFTLFLIVRAVAQLALLPRMTRASFAP